jgi:hypothetical protein
MAKDKNIRLVIPADLNYKLNLHLLKIRNLGVETTKVELVLKLIELGLKAEDHD